MPRTDTVIIGAGHAGLAMSRCLADRGLDHVVLERGSVGERWRTARWDSFRLLTPNWLTRLPGWVYAGPEPDGFMTAGEFADHLSGYARSFDAPVRPHTRGRPGRAHADRVPGAYRPGRLGGANRGHRDRLPQPARGTRPRRPARARYRPAHHRRATGRRRACPTAACSWSALRPPAFRSPTSWPAPAGGWCWRSAATPGCPAGTAAGTSSGGWIGSARWTATSTTYRTPRPRGPSRRCSSSAPRTPAELDLGVLHEAGVGAGRPAARAGRQHRRVRRRPGRHARAPRSARLTRVLDDDRPRTRPPSRARPPDRPIRHRTSPCRPPDPRWTCAGPGISTVVWATGFRPALPVAGACPALDHDGRIRHRRGRHRGARAVRDRPAFPVPAQLDVHRRRPPRCRVPRRPHRRRPRAALRGVTDGVEPTTSSSSAPGSPAPRPRCCWPGRACGCCWWTATGTAPTRCPPTRSCAAACSCCPAGACSTGSSRPARHRSGRPASTTAPIR